MGGKGGSLRCTPTRTAALSGKGNGVRKGAISGLPRIATPLRLGPRVAWTNVPGSKRSPRGVVLISCMRMMCAPCAWCWTMRASCWCLWRLWVTRWIFTEGFSWRGGGDMLSVLVPLSVKGSKWAFCYGPVAGCLLRVAGRCFGAWAPLGLGCALLSSPVCCWSSCRCFRMQRERLEL